MKITEKNITSMSNLMSLCIKENWFCCGTNEDYENFLKKWDKKGHSNITKKDIYEMAKTIWEFSEFPREYTIADVMFLIKKEAVTTLYEIEE